MTYPSFIVYIILLSGKHRVYKKKDTLFKQHTENNTTCHSGNLKSITPQRESKIFLFACKHQSPFHPLANQTKSDQAIKRLSLTPRGAFQS